MRMNMSIRNAGEGFKTFLAKTGGPLAVEGLELGC